MNKIKVTLFLFVISLLLTSCLNNNSTSDLSESIKPYTYGDGVIEYKLKDHDIPSSDLKQFFYIGDGKAVYTYDNKKNEFLDRCYIIDCKTGKVIKEVNYHGSLIQYGNGFAIYRGGNNGIPGRIELSVYDNNGEYIDTIVPSGQHLQYLTFKYSTRDRFSEYPITEELTIRRSSKGLFLYNELTDTSELIFQNSKTAIYSVYNVLDDNFFIVQKYNPQDKATRKNEYGIYNIKDKKLTNLELQNALSPFENKVYNAIDNILVPYKNSKAGFTGGEFFYYIFDNEYNLKKKKLIRTDETQYFADMAISYNNNRFAILIGNKDKNRNTESVDLIIYDTSDMNIVFKKKIKTPQKLYFENYIDVLSFMPNGTLAINLYTTEDEYHIYVIEPEQMKGKSNES